MFTLAILLIKISNHIINILELAVPMKFEYIFIYLPDIIIFANI